MDAREQARALVGEMLDSALGEAKKGKGRKGSSLADEGGEEARGRLIGWLIKRGVIKRRGKPGGSVPVKGGRALKRKKYRVPKVKSMSDDKRHRRAVTKLVRSKR